MEVLVRRSLLYRGRIYRPGDKLCTTDNAALEKWRKNGVVSIRSETPDADLNENGAAVSPDLSVKEIKALLDEKGIEYKVGMKKEEMLTLLNGDAQ